jgi:hypothetical protein
MSSDRACCATARTSCGLQKKSNLNEFIDIFEYKTSISEKLEFEPN